MNRKAKVYVEKQKMAAQAKLEAYLSGLKEKGAEPQNVQKNATIRQLRAFIRHADLRLASIAAQEKLTRDLAEAKRAKLVAAQTPAEEPAQPPAPAKKEKKAKKEKTEKTEPQKEKKEKKPPKAKAETE